MCHLFINILGAGWKLIVNCLYVTIRFEVRMWKRLVLHLLCVAGVPCQGSDNTVEVRSARDSSLY